MESSNRIAADSAVFKRALAVIEASGAQFKIILPDGQAFGALQIAAEPSKPKRVRRHAHGALKEHLRPFLDNLGPGAYVEIPGGPFALDVVARAASSRGCFKWGNGKVIVAQNQSRGIVEVLRIGE